MVLRYQVGVFFIIKVRERLRKFLSSEYIGVNLIKVRPDRLFWILTNKLLVIEIRYDVLIIITLLQEPLYSCGGMFGTLRHDNSLLLVEKYTIHYRQK